MKKLIVLTAIVMLTATMVGCQCGRWFRRGEAAPCCPPDPCCEPCAAPCDVPCGSCATPTFGTGAMVTPSPEAYMAVPSS